MQHSMTPPPKKRGRPSKKEQESRKGDAPQPPKTKKSLRQLAVKGPQPPDPKRVSQRPKAAYDKTPKFETLNDLLTFAREAGFKPVLALADVTIGHALEGLINPEELPGAYALLQSMKYHTAQASRRKEGMASVMVYPYPLDLLNWPCPKELGWNTFRQLSAATQRFTSNLKDEKERKEEHESVKGWALGMTALTADPLPSADQLVAPLIVPWFMERAYALLLAAECGHHRKQEVVELVLNKEGRECGLLFKDGVVYRKRASQATHLYR